MTKCKHKQYRTTTSMSFVRVVDPYDPILPSNSSVALKETKFVDFMVAKVKIFCSACGKSFTFTGQTGYSPHEATVSEALDELRIPVKYPAGEEECKEESEEDQLELFPTPPVYLQ
jgi:hypothetical protein